MKKMFAMSFIVLLLTVEEAMRKEIMALGMDRGKTEKALNMVKAVFTFDESAKMDQPEDTITTRPYYSSSNALRPDEK